MSKIIMEFNLPEEEPEAEIHRMAKKMYSFIWDFKQELRNIWKYSDLDEYESRHDLIDKVYSKYNDMLYDSGITLDF